VFVKYKHDSPVDRLRALIRYEQTPPYSGRQKKSTLNGKHSELAFLTTYSSSPDLFVIALA